MNQNLKSVSVLLSNTFLRRGIIILLFVLGVFPSLVSDSGFGLLPNSLEFIRVVYQPLGILGWTDYGSPIFLLVSLIWSIYIYRNRDKINYGITDKLLSLVASVPAIFLLFGFTMILIVVMKI